MKKNATQEFQNNFNQYLEKQVQKTFGQQIGSNFRAFQHGSDFNYFTNDGTNYNKLSLQCMDALLKQNSETGQLGLEESGFSSLYHSVLNASRYTLSQSSQQKVNDMLLQSSAQAAQVIKLYPAKLPPLTSATQSDRIIEIYENCATAFGGDVTQDCSIIPNIYRDFKIALQTLNNMSEEAAQLVMNVANKNAVLAKIVANLANPSAENGSLPIGNGQYYAAYDKIPMPNALLGSLSTEGNKLTLSISGQSYSQQEMQLHIDNEAEFVIPSPFVIAFGGHKSSFDMYKLQTNSTEITVNITYTGLTKVPIQPQPATIKGDRGWYAETTILKEIKEKSQNPNEDGYKLNGSEFNVEQLFGHDLARLEALLISRLPDVEIKLTNVNMDYAHSTFSTENDTTLVLFGFLEIGHKNSYSTSNVAFNDDESTVTLTFHQPEVSPPVC